MKLINRIIKKMKKQAKKVPFILSVKYKYDSMRIKVEPNTILFSCFNGEAFNDSPKAIYEFMLNNKKYSNYKFVWAFVDPKSNESLLNNKNTIIVKKGSGKYYRYLHCSKYWVFNFKIADYIIPTKDQVFLQCWHGTPLKKMGFDLVNFDNAVNSMKKTKKKYLIEAKKMNYFISPSKYTTEKFTSAWNLKECKKEHILIETGYPRNDKLFNYKDSEINFIKNSMFNKSNINKKIILYAPTWRSNQYEKGVGYTYKCMLDFDLLKKNLSDEYVILFRAHANIHNEFNFEKYKNFVYNVSKYSDINDLYIISDILITDYSSVMYDYGNLKRPMIFFMYDLDYYTNESNGFYIDIEDELPGSITKTNEELLYEIQNINKFKYDEKYKKFNKKYNMLDDGNATKRVVEKVFKD